MSKITESEVQELKQICREIRKSIINTITDAGCGHPGGSLSEVEILSALYFRIMNIDPGNPAMENRDRFVLSKGHSSPGYYCTLANRGYFREEKLADFDAIDSMLQGHPCMIKTPGVDMSTGSLGQGLSAGIGMCLGRDKSGLDFNVYVLVGDGEMQEGQNWEAIMYAGFKKTKGLVGIVDYNKVQLTGTSTDILCLDPLDDKFKAFGWQVIECDGNDIEDVVNAFEKAKELREASPVAIIANSIKGKGVSFMEGKYQWHGQCPSEEQRQQALAEIDSCRD
ncbi:MAG: transketolase [Victivallales bacterium]|nr:transketolase [Victivallales bacterium]